MPLAISHLPPGTWIRSSGLSRPQTKLRPMLGAQGAAGWAEAAERDRNSAATAASSRRMAFSPAGRLVGLLEEC
ncbi:MAG: hypothetical protein BGN82_11100 [Alphaproteobacteria bacterium 65-7]|nr:MAG: hypothetical protein BGN82_11100 [Alphaproteobacteria bacterium 65-7]